MNQALLSGATSPPGSRGLGGRLGAGRGSVADWEFRQRSALPAPFRGLERAATRPDRVAGSVHRLVARGEVEGVRVGKWEHLDEVTCTRLCPRIERGRLNFCKLDDDLPRSPASDEPFLVCVFHRPGGCGRPGLREALDHLLEQRPHRRRQHAHPRDQGLYVARPHVAARAVVEARA